MVPMQEDPLIEAVMGQTYLLEVVSHLKLTLLVCNVSLDLWVGIIDDGQEHIEKDKEHKEDIEHKVGRTQHTISLLQLMEVEVSQDDTEQGEAIKRQQGGVKGWNLPC